MKSYVLWWMRFAFFAALAMCLGPFAMNGEVSQDQIMGTRIVLSRWWDLLFLPLTAAVSAWITFTRKERRTGEEYVPQSLVHSGLRFCFWGGYVFQGGALNGILSAIGVPLGLVIQCLVLLFSAMLWNELQENRWPVFRQKFSEFFSSHDENQEPVG